MNINQAITTVFDVGHPMPGSDRKLLDVLNGLLKQGYREPVYLGTSYFSWGNIAICQGGGNVTNGVSHDLLLWTCDQSLTPLQGSVESITNHINHLRDHGWNWAFT